MRTFCCLLLVSLRRMGLGAECQGLSYRQCCWPSVPLSWAKHWWGCVKHGASTSAPLSLLPTLFRLEFTSPETKRQGKENGTVLMAARNTNSQKYKYRSFAGDLLVCRHRHKHYDDISGVLFQHTMTDIRVRESLWRNRYKSVHIYPYLSASNLLWTASQTESRSS